MSFITLDQLRRVLTGRVLVPAPAGVPFSCVEKLFLAYARARARPPTNRAKKKVPFCETKIYFCRQKRLFLLTKPCFCDTIIEHYLKGRYIAKMSMYQKDLCEEFRLRLTKTDFDFLKDLAAQRGVTVSALVRFIIGDYRRSMTIVESFKKFAEADKEGGLSHGDIKTDFDDLV